MESLVNFWSDLPILTQFFIVATGVLGILLAGPWYSGPAVTFGPAILMSIGIFGTFLGIALGLYAFDTQQVQSSMPGLLDGLKTSMWSSISGLLFALVIKARQLQEGIRSRKSGELATGATIDDLAHILGQVRYALAGDDEATVIGQIKLGRQDTNDRLDSLRNELKAFMEEMAEANSEALIRALEEVIRDFNAKINEQFGENFKQLNQAVEKIVVWQERYREQMSEMIAQQDTAAGNLRIAADGFSQAVDRSQEFEQSAAALKAMLQTINAERQEIHTLTTSLSQSLSECKTAIPDMENKVVSLAEVLSKAIQESNDASIRAINSANSQVNANIQEISEKAAQQVDTLDRELSAQLTESLEMLGRQLAALSEKFVSDYTPLTERLRQVVAMAGSAAR